MTELLWLFRVAFGVTQTVTVQSILSLGHASPSYVHLNRNIQIVSTAAYKAMMKM